MFDPLLPLLGRERGGTEGEGEGGFGQTAKNETADRKKNPPSSFIFSIFWGDFLSFPTEVLLALIQTEYEAKVSPGSPTSKARRPGDRQISVLFVGSSALVCNQRPRVPLR